MFASRVSVLKAVTRIADGKEGQRKRSKQAAEFDLLRYSDRSAISDRDLWENSRSKLRFRKFPWGNWFLGCTWLGGVIWIIWLINHDLLDFHYHKLLKEYLMIFICSLLGLFFLWKGKIKHTIFDKRAGTLTIKKRNTFCDKRSIITYRLKDISDVKAVYRGYKQGTVDTQVYMCIIEMEKYQHQSVDTDDASEYESSEDEMQALKHKSRQQELRQQRELMAAANKKVAAEEQNETELSTLNGTADTTGDSGMTFNDEVEKIKKENIRDLAKSVEDEKDPFRRGIYHAESKGISGIITNQLDRGVKEKRGRKEEIKVLETRNKQRVERQVLAIRKFLRMDVEKFKIIDQRRSRMMPDKLD